MKILPAVELALAPYNPLPHWGKLFTLSREKLHSVYPKMADFIALADLYDPHGKFRNDFLDQFIF